MSTVSTTGWPPGAAALASSKLRPGSTTGSHAGNSAAECECFVLGTAVTEDDGILQCHRPFQESMVPQSLSQLSRTASGSHTAYLRLELTGTDLDSPQAIAHCHCLQQVILSNNQLTTLKHLARLKQLARLDASRNQLTQVLDFSMTCSHSTQHEPPEAAVLDSSNLQYADLSYNLIQEIKDVSDFRRLKTLILDGNRIKRIGSGLQQLHALQHLSLSGNAIGHCRGLEALSSLRTLALDGNAISSLAPLADLASLEVLLVANNQLSNCAGMQGLSSLRRLDLRCNQLRHLEVLAPCQGLSMLSNLDVADNPMEAAQNIRLYLISMLPQVCILNAATVSYTEKVDAANMAGAAAEALMAIRKRYFPAGELDDGGGAVPPTAAGLVPSRAEEELSCENVDAMFETIDAWARAVHPSTALGTATVVAGSARARAARPSSEASSSATGTPGCATPTACGRLTRRSASSIVRNSSAGSRVIGISNRASAIGTAAVAGRLAGGCSKSAPWAQLQLARSCYSWVVEHVRLPRGCSAEAGADMQTWDVGMHLFGEQEQQIQWHQVLLENHSGTYAECVAQLLVELYHAVHMQAVQLSGFWKAGGQHSVGPGDRLASHNHSWVAVKVNGRWRLLDPVYAILKQGQVPFYLPPEAFISTHLPCEAYWQLLPSPISRDQWWCMPEVALPFYAAGGQLQDDQLESCIVLPAVREGQVLPSLKIPITAPASEHQYVCLKLLDQHWQLLASWSHRGQKQQQQRRQHAQCSSSTRGPLVYQQHVLDAEGQQQVLVGHTHKTVRLQELWVSMPAPGSYYVHVELVSETPGWLQLSVDCLAQPLKMSYWQREDVIRIKVVAPPVEPHNPADGICVDPETPVAALPRPEHGFHSCRGFQLLSPQPSKLLEADRPELFEVIAPGAEAVAVGCDELGWQRLQPAAIAMQPGSDQQQWCQVPRLFRGEVVMPRAERCFVAVQVAGSDGEQQGQTASSSRWLSAVSLQVSPQVQHIVIVPDPAPLPEPDAMDPVLPRLRKLLAGLDVDGDGVASRKDLLLAFRRDRQLADHLRMSPKVKVDDGSYDKFVAKFISINKDGLGRIDLKQLYAYMASINSDASTISRLGTAAVSGRLGSADPVGGPPRAVSAGCSAGQHYSPATNLAA